MTRSGRICSWSLKSFRQEKRRRKRKRKRKRKTKENVQLKRSLSRLLIRGVTYRITQPLGPRMALLVARGILWRGSGSYAALTNKVNGAIEFLYDAIKDTC